MQLKQQPCQGIYSISADKQAASLATGVNKGHQGKIAQSLAAAAYALLSPSPSQANNTEANKWRFDAAILYYGEDGNRVQAIEPVISATRDYDEDRSLSAKLVVDTLTGASPSGATPSNEAQTFTQPSGSGEYTIAPKGETLDPSFRDTRAALSVSWRAALNEVWDYNVGLYASREYDYRSGGINGGLSRFFHQKNTQLNLGAFVGYDSVNPVGKVPFGLQRMSLPNSIDFQQTFDTSRRASSDTKSLLDAIIGVTQVISKRIVMQVNYSVSHASGYLSDPYKILSVIDDGPASTRYGDFAHDTSGDGIYIYEQRPDSRLKHALYWEGKYRVPRGDVITGAYRLMRDDWGIASHTADLKYRWELGDSYLEPHLRFYRQTEADFYHRYLTLSEFNTNVAAIQYASADYRIGELSTMTIGLKYARQLSNERSWSIRLEYYMQKSNGDKGFGELLQQALYPDQNAIMTTLGFGF